jgi:hypothetical protein
MSTFPMDTAPRDCEVTLLARRTVLGLGPVDERPFLVRGRCHPEHGIWAAEDRPPLDMPSLGLIPLEPTGWRPQ